MGDFLKEHDIYVDSLLGQMNLRFAPPQGKDSQFGGLDEMVALQKEFKIFKKGRSFKTSAMALHIGGSVNHEAKNRLHEYFGNLSSHDSNIAGQNGDQAIVNALIKNLASKSPLPVYFTYHDMRAEKGNTRVLISTGRAVSYFKHDYLTISFPTKPATTPAKKTAKARKA